MIKKQNKTKQPTTKEMKTKMTLNTRASMYTTNFSCKIAMYVGFVPDFETKKLTGKLSGDKCLFPYHLPAYSLLTNTDSNFSWTHPRTQIHYLLCTLYAVR